MAENPLLPNSELRALYALLQRAAAQGTQLAATMVRRVKGRSGEGSEALLAGTLLQLRAGDVLVPTSEQGDRAHALLTPATKRRAVSIPSLVRFEQSSPRLLFANGLASAVRRSGQDGLVLSFSDSGVDEPQWADALTWAQQEALPSILLCADRSGDEAFRTTLKTESAGLTWAALQRLAGKLKLPVLTVDGQDAVAVYRVMQESVLRARAGGGPAVLWAVLPTQASRGSRFAQPSSLARLEHYMSARSISLK